MTIREMIEKLEKIEQSAGSDLKVRLFEKDSVYETGIVGIGVLIDGCGNVYVRFKHEYGTY